MTNAELIKALQNCANVNYEYRAEGASCSKCPYKEVNYCKRTMLRDASDALEAADEKIADYTAAIEALDDSNDAYIKENERLKKQIAELANQAEHTDQVDAMIFATHLKQAARIAELEAQLPKEGERIEGGFSGGVSDEITKAWGQYIENERASEKIAVEEDLDRRRRELEELKRELEELNRRANDEQIH